MAFNSSSNSNNNNNQSLGEILSSLLIDNDPVSLFSPNYDGNWAEEVERSRDPFEADIPNLCVHLYVEIIPDINLGLVPTEQPPIRSDVPPSRKESLAKPSSPADSTTVIVPSPTKEETKVEAPVCVYRIPKKVKFNVPKVSPLKRKNDFPEKVEVKPELKEGVIAFSLTDRAPMLIQKNLGGGKARCLLQNDSKSRIRNHQELVLLKLDGFLTPEQAGALRRENRGLKERVLTLQKYLHRSTQQLWSAEKERETLLM